LFAILKAAREQKNQQQAEFFANMVEVAAVPQQPAKYANELRKHWTDIAMNLIPESLRPDPVKRELTPPPVMVAMLKRAEEIKRSLGRG